MMQSRLVCGECGDAVVEAAILFPVMTLIFAALVLIAIYLPAQAMLQQSTQYAATALATEISDTWLGYSEGGMTYYWEKNKNALPNVYEQLFGINGAEISNKGETITENTERRSLSSRAGELEVTSYLDSKLIYKEIVVSASRRYEVPVNLSVIGFPREVVVSASSVAVVQNSDEFVRNADLATDFVNFCEERLGLSDIGDIIGKFGNRVKSLLGWE